MTLYFYKIISSFFQVKLRTFHNKIKKKRENIYIFKRNMLILIDVSKIVLFFKVFLDGTRKIYKVKTYKN